MEEGGRARAGGAHRERPDPNTARASEMLTRALGTRVRIERSGKGGALVVEFYSEEELQRLYTLLLDAARASGGSDQVKGGQG
jgi:hypothetical protein